MVPARARKLGLALARAGFDVSSEALAPLLLSRRLLGLLPPHTRARDGEVWYHAVHAVAARGDGDRAQEVGGKSLGAVQATLGVLGELAVEVGAHLFGGPFVQRVREGVRVQRGTTSESVAATLAWRDVKAA